MPSIGDWFGIYSSQRDNVGAVAAATNAVRAQLESFRAEMTGQMYPQIAQIVQSLNAIAAAQGGQGAEHLAGIRHALENAFPALWQPWLASIESSVKESAGAESAIAQTLKVFLTDMDVMLSRVATGVEDSALAQQEIAERINKLIDALFEEHSPALIPTIISIITTAGPYIIKILPAIPALFAVFERLMPEKWAQAIKDSLDAYADIAKDASRGMFGVIDAPFAAMVDHIMDDLVNTLTALKVDISEAPTGAAKSALSLGHKFGLEAHGLATAIELISPLKYLGMGQMAAYITDLAGFKPISQAIAGSLIAGAITRPARWWGNAVFQPEIPGRTT